MHPYTCNRSKHLLLEYFNKVADYLKLQNITKKENKAPNKTISMCLQHLNISKSCFKKNCSTAVISIQLHMPLTLINSPFTRISTFYCIF